MHPIITICIITAPLIAWCLIISKTATSLGKAFFWFSIITTPSLIIQLTAFLKFIDINELHAVITAWGIAFFVPAGLGFFIKGFRNVARRFGIAAIKFLNASLPSKQTIAQEIKNQLVETLAKQIVSFILGISVGGLVAYLSGK